jgi:hypothetical protein
MSIRRLLDEWGVQIDMNAALFKTLVALLPASLLLVGSAVQWTRAKTLYGFMQLVGAGGIVTVVLAHVCEALQLLPGMHWGSEHSPGHYVDLTAAIVGFTLFPAGSALQALSRNSRR